MSPELTAILLRGQETKDFDYKAAIAWDERDKAACCSIVEASWPWRIPGMHLFKGPAGRNRRSEFGQC